MALADMVSAVLEALQDDLLSEAEAKSSCVRGAERFSGDAPRILSEEYNGTGSAYEFVLPSTWQDGFSSVLAVEYPSGERIPSILFDERYLVLDTTLRLLYDTPSSTEKVKVWYSAPHSLTETATSLSNEQEGTVIEIAVSYAARILAGKYLRMFDPGLVSEGIDYGRKGEDYLRLATSYEASYTKRVSGAILGSAILRPSMKLRTIRAMK